MTTSPSATLGNYAVTAKLGAMSQATVTHGIDSFVNLIGCIIGGSREGPVEAAMRSCLSIAPNGPYSMLGRPEKVGLLDAISLDCLSSSSLAFDDTHLETILHPTGPVVAGLLGLARTRKISGKQYLEAQIMGIEVECRVGLAFASKGTGAKLGWYATGLAGGIGTAAAIGRILGFNEAQMCNAFGLAAAGGCGNRGTHASMTGLWPPAIAAEYGFKSAKMTEAGFTCGTSSLDGKNGMIELLTEKPGWDYALNGLGSTSQAARTAFKPYPCGIICHPIIDAVLSLVKDHGVSAKDVQELELYMSETTANLGRNTRPPDVYRAHVSNSYWAAAVLVTGSAGVELLEQKMISDPKIAAVEDRVRSIVAPEVAGDASRVVAKLTDGRKIEVNIKHATGSVDNPMTSADIDKKFKALSGPLKSAERAEKLLHACRNVLELDDVSSILRI